MTPLRKHSYDRETVKTNLRKHNNKGEQLKGTSLLRNHVMNEKQPKGTSNLRSHVMNQKQLKGTSNLRNHEIKEIYSQKVCLFVSLLNV